MISLSLTKSRFLACSFELLLYFLFRQWLWYFHTFSLLFPLLNMLKLFINAFWTLILNNLFINFLNNNWMIFCRIRWEFSLRMSRLEEFICFFLSFSLFQWFEMGYCVLNSCETVLFFEFCLYRLLFTIEQFKWFIVYINFG